MRTENEIVSLKNISKSFGNFNAVDEISLTVQEGDVYGFLGPNGAGKSTTLRMMLGLIFPTKGEVNIFGLPFNRNRSQILKQIGAIIEKPDFYNYLPADKNLKLFSQISGNVKDIKQIHAMLDFVGLQGRYHHKVKTYSHGMKQRLGLAQALLNDPRLIVLDEPTTGLDPQGIIDIRNLILHLSRDKNITVVLSSHILSEIELIASRMVIINKGKKIAEGKVSELLNEQQLQVYFDVDNTHKALQVLQNVSLNISGVHEKENMVVLQTSQNNISTVNKLLVDSGVNVSGINQKRPLEELFLKLTND